MPGNGIVLKGEQIFTILKEGTSSIETDLNGNKVIKEILTQWDVIKDDFDAVLQDIFEITKFQ